MKITVIGCGRWGSLITWYLDRLGHDVSLYGRAGSRNMQEFLKTRKNDLLTLPESVNLTTDISGAKDADVLIVSINSQGLRDLFEHDLSTLNLQNFYFYIFLKRQIFKQNFFQETCIPLHVFRKNITAVP